MVASTAAGVAARCARDGAHQGAHQPGVAAAGQRPQGVADAGQHPWLRVVLGDRAARAAAAFGRVVLVEAAGMTQSAQPDTRRARRCWQVSRVLTEQRNCNVSPNALKLFCQNPHRQVVPRWRTTAPAPRRTRSRRRRPACCAGWCRGPSGGRSDPAAPPCLCRWDTRTSKALRRRRLPQPLRVIAHLNCSAPGSSVPLVGAARPSACIGRPGASRHVTSSAITTGRGDVCVQQDRTYFQPDAMDGVSAV